MTVVLFTCTVRPGLDVSIESVRRQTRKPDIWLISDHLKTERRRVYEDYLPDSLPDVETVVFNARELTDRPYTIQAAYNHALRFCRDLGGVNLLISMEDYIWIPPTGIERFVRMALGFPRCLLSGIVSGSADPDASLVVDRDGMLTIFAEPYTGEPQRLLWEDCRLDRGRTGFQYPESQRWEPPFAAVPKALLDDDRLWFNEEYDRGMTHGNQWFSAKAQSLGYPTVLDLENRGWALPHKAYFPDQVAWFEAGDNHAFHQEQKAANGWD